MQQKQNLCFIIFFPSDEGIRKITLKPLKASSGPQKKECDIGISKEQAVRKVSHFADSFTQGVTLNKFSQTPSEELVKKSMESSTNWGKR